MLAADSLSRGTSEWEKHCAGLGPRKKRMENSLTPRPPRGPGWGADSRTRGGRGPPSPRIEERRGRLRRRGPERTWAQVVGARRRGQGGGVHRGLPSAGRCPGAASQKQRAALLRGLPPSLGVPHARGPAHSWRTRPSCRCCRRRRRLPLPLPPPPAAGSALLLRQPRWLAPNPHPHPGVPGPRGKRPPPRPSVGWAGPRRAPGCGAGARASERAGCVCRYSPAEAAAPASLPRRGPRPHSGPALQASSE